MRSMARLTGRRIWMVFAALFVVALGGVLAFEQIYRQPGKRCEANGGWWDMSQRICGQVVYIPDITGRAPGESREAASKRGAREIIVLEREYEAEQAARAAEVAQQRKALDEARGR